MKNKFIGSMMAALLLTVACQKNSNEKKVKLDPAEAGDCLVDRSFSAEKLGEVRVQSQRVFSQGLTEADCVNDSLVVGLPVSILGQEHVFGGVITKTDAYESDKLGRLKLTDLTPIHVQPQIFRESEDSDALVMVLSGCSSDCGPDSEAETIIAFSVQGFSEDQQTFYIDFSEIGEGLNLAEIIDENGEYTELQEKESHTSLVDYQDDTLIFDVSSEMEPKEGSSETRDVSFTTRWYLKLNEGGNTHFEAQEAAEGVGYFMTMRNRVERITRFATKHSDGSDATVHYYMKHVPDYFKAAFAEAMDQWNQSYRDIIGRDLLSYEFVDVDDPRSPYLVTGDIRYNILEWDLYNNAPYGGLGPSIGDQNTGAMISANVLVQGPIIEMLYTDWFNVNQEVQELRAQGLNHQAELMLAENSKRLMEKVTAFEKSSLKFQLRSNSNKALSFNVRSQSPELQDPLMQNLHFDEIPAGHTYETYMHGYFLELVGHEIGHNLGLRHNFKGNLLASDDLGVGEVSSSIMEYLGRAYRHNNRIAEYDEMALRYGYAQVLPHRTDIFCTDGDVASLSAQNTGSAECSRDDAENDPFAYFESEFIKSRDLMVARGNSEEPAWTWELMDRYFNKNLDGIILYGTTAESHMNSWIRFFNGRGRPSAQSSDVQEYVENTLKAVVCDPHLEDELIADKPDPVALGVALGNLEGFREKTLDRMEEAFKQGYSCQ